MFYELGRQFPSQKIRYYSVTGDGYSGTIKQNFSLNAILTPPSNMNRFFSPSSNRTFGYGTDVVIISAIMYLSITELAKKQLTPKMEDFVIAVLPSVGRKKMFIASIVQTIEDVIVLALKTPVPIDNNDCIDGKWEDNFKFFDQNTKELT